MSGLQRNGCATAVVCLSMLVWPTPGYASPRELLYVRDGQSLITYRIDAKTAAARKLGKALRVSASADYPIQMLSSPDGAFLYILGSSSATEEFIWVYATSATGVPAAKPVQVIAVKPALTQFLIHPSGDFAYAMYSWATAEVAYVSNIVLYTIDRRTGELTNTERVVADYPENYYRQTSIYGLGQDGMRLYARANVDFRDSNGNVFSYYAVNAKTGTLGPGIQFWSDDAGSEGLASTSMNDRLIALAHHNGYDDSDTGIDLYSNEVNPTAAVVHCTSAMAKVCGDTLTNGSVQFAPSGRYLFINDVSIRSVVVVGIDLKQHLLAETGGSLPGNPQSISFSADGGLLYAVKERNIFIYVFNAVTGLITSSRSVGFPMSVSGILPGSRP